MQVSEDTNKRNIKKNCFSCNLIFDIRTTETPLLFTMAKGIELHIIQPAQRVS